MPPAKSRNLFTLILDMQDLRFVKNILDLLIVDRSRKNGANDEAMVILLNSADNDIEVVQSEPILIKRARLMEIIDEHEPSELQSSVDWANALDEGLDLIDNIIDPKGIRTYYMVIVSSLQTPSAADLKKHAKNLQHNDIRLIVCSNIDISFNVEVPIKDLHTLKTAYDKAVISPLNDNIQKALIMLKDCTGALTNFKLFLDIVRFLEHPAKKQDWNEGLMVGNYRFATKTRKIIEKENCLLHHSFGNRKEKSYYRVAATPNDYDPNIHDVAIEMDEISKGFSFKGTVIVRPVDVANSFKPTGPRSFKVLGFVDKADIPELSFGGDDTLCVTADINDLRGHHFREFVLRVAAKQKYVIASRVYSARNKAKLFVLIPQETGWFLMTELPRKISRISRNSSKCVGNDEDDNIKISPGMLAVRERLLSKQKQIFHPHTVLGFGTHYIIENLRKEVGYAGESYEMKVPPEEIVNEEFDELVGKSFGNTNLGDLDLDLDD